MSPLDRYSDSVLTAKEVSADKTNKNPCPPSVYSLICHCLGKQMTKPVRMMGRAKVEESDAVVPVINCMDSRFVHFEAFFS